jgi:hypothetical protein
MAAPTSPYVLPDVRYETLLKLVEHVMKMIVGDNGVFGHEGAADSDEVHDLYMHTLVEGKDYHQAVPMISLNEVFMLQGELMRKVGHAHDAYTTRDKVNTKQDVRTGFRALCQCTQEWYVRGLRMTANRASLMKR